MGTWGFCEERWASLLLEEGLAAGGPGTEGESG